MLQIFFFVVEITTIGVYKTTSTTMGLLASTQDHSMFLLVADQIQTQLKMKYTGGDSINAEGDDNDNDDEDN